MEETDLFTPFDGGNQHLPLSRGAFTAGGMVATALTKPRRSTSILDQAKVRNLYLSQSVSHDEIAKQVGWSTSQVSSYVSRAGLVELRRKREERLMQRVDEKLDAQLEPISQHIAENCEEIAMSGLNRAKGAVEDKSKDAPKNFQAWTAGVRNLVTARNLARNSGSVNTLGDGGDGRSVNLFFLQSSEAKDTKGMRAVDTVDDVL